MMHPYRTLADGTTVLHSDLKPDDDGGRVLVHFERPTDTGFDSVRFELPSYEMTPWEGSFTEKELEGFKEFLAANAHLLYAVAAEGGTGISHGAVVPRLHERCESSWRHSHREGDPFAGPCPSTHADRTSSPPPSGGTMRR